MLSFVDKATIKVISGAGGNGIVSFRREKYVPFGGPDGGDGGRGGDIIFVARNNLQSLSHLVNRQEYKAATGQVGRSKDRSGATGDSITISVPLGTIIRNQRTGIVLKDFTVLDEEWICLKGGGGGRGNTKFKNSSRRAPRICTNGESGKELIISTELRTIAHIGLVGLPNAGKSTLLRALTNSKSKVGDYPFTTRIPHIGVMNDWSSNGFIQKEKISFQKEELLIADIPGILEGASEGAGLGLQFLDHIARTMIIAFVVDLASANSRSIAILEKELIAFDRDLVMRRRLIIGTKADLDKNNQLINDFIANYSYDEVIVVSAHSGYGIDSLRWKFKELMDRT